MRLKVLAGPLAGALLIAGLATPATASQSTEASRFEVVSTPFAGLRALVMVEPDRALAASRGGIVQFDLESGTATLIPESPKDVAGLAFATGDEGIAVGSGIWQTSDAGRNWTQVVDSGIRLADVHYVGDGEIVAAGERYVINDWRPVILRSTDGGQTWRETTTVGCCLLGGRPIRAVSFQGAEGWAIGAAGEVLFTSDAGRLWTPAPQYFQDVLCDCPRPWVDLNAVEGGALLVQADGTIIWTFRDDLSYIWLYTPEDAQPTAIDRAGSSAVVVGQDGLFLHSDEWMARFNWSEFRLDDDLDFTAIQHSSATTALAVTAGGHFVRFDALAEKA